MAAVERERLETGVQFVGAGPATLSAAIRLVALCPSATNHTTQPSGGTTP